MIKVNSKVIIKELKGLRIDGKDCPPVMIVEGLYHENQFGIWNINDDKTGGAKAITEVLKPLNYNTADTHNHIHELQVKKS